MMQEGGNVNYKSLVITSLALHFSLLLYLFVLYFLAYSGQWTIWTPDWRLFPGNNGLLYMFAPLSLVMAALAIFFPKIVPSARPSLAQLTMDATPASSGLILNFSPPTSSVQTQTIIRMTIAEIIAIFGFVLGYLNHAPLVAVPFIAVALVVQFVVGPVFGRMR